MDVVATLGVKDAAFAKWAALVGADELVQAMVNIPFTPSLGLLVGDIAIANFTGYASLATSGGGVLSFRNAAKGGRDVIIRGAANDWEKQASNTVNLPQSIFGLIVSDGASTLIYCSKLLDPPVPITGVGEGASFELTIFTYFDSVLR